MDLDDAERNRSDTADSRHEARSVRELGQRQGGASQVALVTSRVREELTHAKCRGQPSHNF